MNNQNRTIYFKGLNGIRALAALAVVFIHIAGFHKKRFGLPSFNDGINLKLEEIGSDAVTVFFTLSGFLITYLLLQEKKITGTVDVKKFYVRRVLRIWPLYYLYLGIALIVIALFKIHIAPLNIFFYFFLCGNIPYILGTSFYVIGHFWSIGVEEQFYIIWPFLLKQVQKNILLKLCIGLIFFCVVKLLVYTNYQVGSIPYGIVSTNRFDCMMIGAVFATLLYNGQVLPSTTKSVNLIICLSAIVLLCVIEFNNPFHSMLISILTCILINSQIQEQTFLINLDKPLFNFLGKISYGIYVIHPLVLFCISSIIKTSTLPVLFKYICAYVGGFTITILIAYLSYEYFEKKILLLKEKYTIVRSSTLQTGNLIQA